MWSFPTGTALIFGATNLAQAVLGEQNLPFSRTVLDELTRGLNHSDVPCLQTCEVDARKPLCNRQRVVLQLVPCDLGHIRAAVRGHGCERLVQSGREVDGKPKYLQSSAQSPKSTNSKRKR
jgi:hypothetical protein